jgi:hypothetical protein
MTSPFSNSLQSGEARYDTTAFLAASRSSARRASSSRSAWPSSPVLANTLPCAANDHRKGSARGPACDACSIS